VTVALALLTLLTGTAAGADPISDKREEAASITAKLNDQARRIVAADIAYRQAERQRDEAEAAVSQAEVELAATTRRQDDLKRLLVVQAQDSYVVGGSVSVLRYLVDTSQSDQVVRRAYLRIVTGQDRKVIGQLRAAREDLQALRDRLDAARRRARAQADLIGADRNALDQVIRVQRSNLAAVTDELVGLVSAEQARLAAEAAREAAARNAAAPSRNTPNDAPLGVQPIRAAQPSPVGDTFACIRQLESGNNSGTPGGGAYQYLASTWQALGYSGTASDAPPAVQDQAARQLQAQSGWSPWTTAALCGQA